MNEAANYIFHLPVKQRSIMLFLDELILGFPGTTSKLRYGIPFYYKKSWICYLNPIKNQGVELAFTRANELSNEQGLLMSNGRKQVAGIAIYNINDLDIPLLTQVLSEALLLDEKVPYASKRKK